MKKIISLILVLVIVFSLSVPVFATNGESSTDETMFSFYNDVGDIVTVVSSRTNTTTTAEVYLNGLLAQKSVADIPAKTIDTVIFDLTSVSRSTIPEKKGTMGEFVTSEAHALVSNKRIDIPNLEVQSRSIFNEPVENNGLSLSPYGDGYYYLGSYSGFVNAPNVYGYLYRTYTRTNDGLTKYWNWDAGTSLSAISVYIDAYGGPKNAILALLAFSVDLLLSYVQSIKLETYTFDYHYKVRVCGSVHYTTQRNITYWKVTNQTRVMDDWEQKRFNYGFTPDNGEMVWYAVQNYLLSRQ